MESIKNIVERFDKIKPQNNNLSYSLFVIDNFLPLELAHFLSNECDSIPIDYWTTFTRNGSLMKECNKLDKLPYAYSFTNEFHSSIGMQWLSKITGIPNLIPDPYIIGAGYSKIETGNLINVHVDFNWNDTLKLHRAFSFIVYLTPNWKEEFGGSLDFYDAEKNQIVESVPTYFNRAVIWEYHKHGYHGCTSPVIEPNIVRKAFRLFFYTSNAVFLDDDPPHRSLYWFDDKTKQPFDKRNEK